MKRRQLLKAALGSGLLTPSLSAQAQQHDGTISLIDLDRCDGCPGSTTPRCVLACRVKNRHRFPEPEKPILPYWPQVKFEDYSDKRNLTNRLTPYNWLYVERVQIEGRDVFVPRRCMHCDVPSCQKLCPFGTIGKSSEGAVMIDHQYCFGGAKCRDVCPWHIPQRQAGVGLYLDIAPKFAGGGLMYKCDMCDDLLQKGQQPACQSACPRDAVIFGEKTDLLSKLPEMAAGRYLYGLDENGGTRTIYISSIPFENIDRALADKYEHKTLPGRPHMHTNIQNQFDETQNTAKLVMSAPVIGLTAAAGAALWLKNKRQKHSEE